MYFLAGILMHVYTIPFSADMRDAHVLNTLDKHKITTLLNQNIDLSKYYLFLISFWGNKIPCTFRYHKSIQLTRDHFLFFRKILSENATKSGKGFPEIGHALCLLCKKA